MKEGLGIGNLLAAILSYAVNGSVLWAIPHAILGWLYVIYWVLVK